MIDGHVDELRKTLARIGELSMDAPVLAETIAQARFLASQIELVSLGGFPSEFAEGGKKILKTIAACLRSAADGHVLFVYVVPTSLSAGQLLAQPKRCTAVALAGTLFELETLLPVPGAAQTPDVPIDSLTKRRTK